MVPSGLRSDVSVSGLSDMTRVASQRSQDGDCSEEQAWLLAPISPPKGNSSDSAYRVTLGEHQLSNPSPSWVSSPVRQILVHPDYNRGTRSADIALVKLTEPVRYTDEILPICLPGPSHSFPGNHTCWVTGWGTTASAVSLPPPKTLQEVPVQLMDTAACNALYNIDLAPNIGRDPIKPNMICASYAEGKRDSCQGDSGGPLTCDHNGTWFLMGVVSWGDGCGQPNRPGVYVWTVAYGEWIWGHMVSRG
ncbi:serine protease 27-like [Mauremys mutica]|uniref:serine protease 27-like n=1 Tax=Mauremys mutica TaxID=74926 RepID=UPI001D16D48D|nr:serine protease 27-like [Mauremys mutica]